MFSSCRDSPTARLLTVIQANVDAVFIDICRQLLLRDEKYGDLDRLSDDRDYEKDGIMGLGKRRRRRTRRPDGNRCVIL